MRGLFGGLFGSLGCSGWANHLKTIILLTLVYAKSSLQRSWRKEEKQTLFPGQPVLTPDPSSIKALSRAQLQGRLLSLLRALSQSWWGVFPPRYSSSTRGNVVGWFSILLFFFKQIINQLKPNGISWDVKAFLSLTAFSSLNPRPAAKNMFFRVPIKNNPNTQVRKAPGGQAPKSSQ